MAPPWDGFERRTCVLCAERGSRRARVGAAWTAVRVESIDCEVRGGALVARAWVRLGQLAPADVVVELVTPPSVGCRMWSEQSYRNGSFLYTARVPRVAVDGVDAEDVPETWAVRVTPARRWSGATDVPAIDVPPVIRPAGRVTFGSGPGRAPAGRIRCGA